MTAKSSVAPSINARAAKIVDEIVANASALRCTVSTGDGGERRIDLGAEVTGGLEAGRMLAEVCLGGLGTVSITPNSGLERWPLGVVVHSSNPVIACLGSQYAGWTITEEQSGFFALGSGPARALSRVEKLYADLGYVDHHSKGALVIEGDKAPPSSVAKSVATACGIAAKDLTILYAPTGSLAGTVQIAARVLEVALHKAHELHFPLDKIEDGYGVAPLAPPIPDFVKAMGRTNDAIIYGGSVQLFVTGPDGDAEKLAKDLPSAGARDYGRPFAEIFNSYDGDFYAMDRLLFSPARVTVTALASGRTFHGGALDEALIDKSFGYGAA